MIGAVRLMSSPRTILLCDLDAFFAAVEIIDRPELAGRPVIVGGRPGSRGVVATCNYEARRYGIRSAMPVAEAKRRCPHAIFLPLRRRRYVELSRQVMAIYARYAGDIEPVSIDEAYLDVGRRPGRQVAVKIKRAVRQETGLVVSIGVGPNKFLAKLACELSKPDGLRQIDSSQALALLSQLTADKIPGIGPKTAERLRQIGVITIGDLQKRPMTWFRQVFGQRGESLFMLARGIDDRPVRRRGRAKSISDEVTFDRNRPAEQLLPALRRSCAQVGSRLRQAGLQARTVTIKVRFADFETITRSRTVAEAVGDAGSLYVHARQLWADHVFGGRRLIRLLGVRVSKLSGGDAVQQICLFDGW